MSNYALFIPTGVLASRGGCEELEKELDIEKEELYRLDSSTPSPQILPLSPQHNPCPELPMPESRLSPAFLDSPPQLKSVDTTPSGNLPASEGTTSTHVPQIDPQLLAESALATVLGMQWPAFAPRQHALLDDNGQHRSTPEVDDSGGNKLAPEINLCDTPTDSPRLQVPSSLVNTSGIGDILPEKNAPAIDTLSSLHVLGLSDDVKHMGEVLSRFRCE